MDKYKYKANILGIDLGTTYSCISVWKNDKVEIIPNKMGESTTPSVVSFSNDKILIGKEAKKQITRNYENTIYDVKRLIGRKYTDKTVEEDMKLWPFIIEKDENNNPQIIVNYKGEKRKYYPKEISAMILKQLKEDAEKYLEEEIKDVVITVPADFNNNQRYEIIEAAKIVGLNVFQIIDQATAAAIAYGFQQNSKNKNKKNICVLDFGGGTFDVTILEIDNKTFSVKASEGDSHLGGTDIDNLLVKHCINEFKKENDIDISSNKKALRRLKIYCENIKKNLSQTNEESLDIESLAEGENLFFGILRSDLNDLCENKFKECLKIVKNTLDISGLRKNEIDNVVLVGGSSRIPKIQEMLIEFFGDKNKIYKTINADEAVAYGASIVGAYNNEYQRKDFKKSLLNLNIKDINPHSLGIPNGNKMFFMIKRGDKIPCEISKRIKTTKDYQKFFGINIYEGEDNLIQNNRKIGSCVLDNLRIDKKRKVIGIITFVLDNKYSLTIIVEEEGRKNKRILEIDREKINKNTLNEGIIEEDE